MTGAIVGAIAPRPSMDRVLSDIAYVMAQRGTCSRYYVGAVVARDGRILSSGYNGVPADLPHCDHPADSELPPGPDDSPYGCRRAMHAEANAIAFAARYGVPLAGATLYVTLSPCVNCAQLIINVGIERVVYRKPYRIELGLALLRQVGIRVVHLPDRADVPVEDS